MCDWNTGISVQSKPVLTNYNVIPEARGGEHGEGGAPENCGQGGEHGRRSRRPQVQLHWELSERQVQLQKGVKAMQLPLPQQEELCKCRCVHRLKYTIDKGIPELLELGVD